MQWKDVTDHVNDYQYALFFLKLLPMISENKDQAMYGSLTNFLNILK